MPDYVSPTEKMQVRQLESRAVWRQASSYMTATLSYLLSLGQIDDQTANEVIEDACVAKMLPRVTRLATPRSK
jgi:hypothetical protein